MSHDHSHHHDDAAGGGGNLKMAFLLNLAFTILEAFGGVWTNSIAILTDAVHDTGDCISLGVAWYLHRLSLRGRSARYTYGYRRFSVLGALITGLTLLVGLVFVLWHAWERLRQPEMSYAPGMVALAVIGVVMNGSAVAFTRRGTSINERVVSWHLLEDTLGWVAVLMGALLMLWRPWPLVDPILSILISCFVLFNLVRNLRHALFVMLQKAPPSFDLGKFEAELMKAPRVRQVHRTHVWTLDGAKHVLTTHVVMPAGSSRGEILAIKERVRQMLDPHEFEHVTVDVELEGETCVNEPSEAADQTE
jgi:cobalt-zinc-cadmium efflux system protein